jgi:hypothetical protein
VVAVSLKKVGKELKEMVDGVPMASVADHSEDDDSA